MDFKPSITKFSIQHSIRFSFELQLEYMIPNNFLLRFLIIYRNFHLSLPFELCVPSSYSLYSLIHISLLE